MEPGPLIVSVLFSFVAMILSAVVVARSEGQIESVKRQLKSMKAEWDKISKDSQGIERRLAELSRRTDRLETTDKANFDVSTAEIAALNERLVAMQTEIGKIATEKRRPSS